MSRAFWKFYIDLTKFNLGISFLVAFIASFWDGILMFATGGMVLSLLAYSYFHFNEYYLYYNSGLTKARLVLTSWVINIGISILLMIAVLAF
jgi:small-conductance mechanosensitive channel